ncbi:expressed unknown protein [Seminavis robusta]|uniref:Uncharacterized protein n=1 Tax=Seminavis robusta TaxID=568900 RepID=A0A9N8HW43_9STRA|nr:expressed unknown protein [Seminavis robusta]|eukprot:Sro2125_g315640.1 n/a (379) ;mRNA; r:3616-4752
MVKTRSEIKRERDTSGYSPINDTPSAKRKLEFKTPNAKSQAKTTSTKTRSARKPPKTPRQKKPASTPLSTRVLRSSNNSTPNEMMKSGRAASSLVKSTTKTPRRRPRSSDTPTSTRALRSTKKIVQIKEDPMSPQMCPPQVKDEAPTVPSDALLLSPDKMISFETPRKIFLDDVHCVFSSGMTPFSTKRNTCRPPTPKSIHGTYRNTTVETKTGQPKKMVFFSPTSRSLMSPSESGIKPKRALFLSPTSSCPFASPMDTASVGTFTPYTHASRATAKSTTLVPSSGDSPLMMYISFVNGFEGKSPPPQLRSPKTPIAYSPILPQSLAKNGEWTYSDVVQKQSSSPACSEADFQDLAEFDVKKFDEELGDLSFLDDWYP